MAKLRIPFLDYSNEGSTVAFNVADAILDAAITAVVNAVAGLTVDGKKTAVLVTEEDKDAGISGKATDALAHREIKYLVRYSDNVTGKIYRAEIPCADLSLLDGDTDFLSLSSTEGAAFVTAFEANCLSEVGNAVTVQSIQFVGRNL